MMMMVWKESRWMLGRVGASEEELTLTAFNAKGQGQVECPFPLFSYREPEAASKPVARKVTWDSPLPSSPSLSVNFTPEEEEEDGGGPHRHEMRFEPFISPILTTSN